MTFEFTSPFDLHKLENAEPWPRAVTAERPVRHTFRDPLRTLEVVRPVLELASGPGTLAE